MEGQQQAFHLHQASFTYTPITSPFGLPGTHYALCSGPELARDSWQAAGHSPTGCVVPETTQAFPHSANEGLWLLSSDSRPPVTS